MKEEVVTDILEKGTDLIFKNGYHSVGLKKLLDTAGIPKGSFYYYFTNKEDFGLKAIEFYSKNTVEFMKSFLDQAEVDPKDRIFNLLEAVKAIYQDQGFTQGCLLGNCSLELAAQKESFSDMVSGKFDQWEKLFANTIREGQDIGSINKNTSAEDLAAFLINTWEGALVRMKAIKSNQPMNLFIEMMKKLL